MNNLIPMLASEYITVTTQAIGDMIRVEIADLGGRLLYSYVVETDIIHKSPPIRLTGVQNGSV